MKNILLLIGILLSSTFSVHAQSQAEIGFRMPVAEKQVPLLVKGTFENQYDERLSTTGWFATHSYYWQNDISSNWYYDWYTNRTITVYTFDKPSYYEVEFIQYPGEISRALYNLYGYWYETRTKISGLPMTIMDALNNSQYKDWKLSLMRERIESPSWPISVYRFQLKKGLKTVILRMDEEGNIIQTRTAAY